MKDPYLKQSKVSGKRLGLSERAPPVQPGSRHPFDLLSPTVFAKALRYSRILLRTREFQGGSPGKQVAGAPKLLGKLPVAPKFHLPQPAAVRPVVTS